MQKVACDDAHMGWRVRWQRRSQVAVDLDSHDPPDLGGQGQRHGTSSGADFEHGVTRVGPNDGDQLVDPGRFEEMLSEAPPDRHVQSISLSSSMNPRQ